jgi:endonuclease IV
MLIRKKCLKIQERLGMRIGVAYGTHRTPVVQTAEQTLTALELFYKTGFRAFLLPRELFAKVTNISGLYKEHYNNLLKIKNIANKYNIELAVHNNSLPDDPKLDEELRIYCNIANVMDLRALVIHPDFFRRMPQDQARRLVVYKINEIINELRISAKIGIETTGSVKEMGSVEDVLDIVKRTKNTEPVFNWAHIHGRSSGVMTSETDFRRILETTRAQVGQQWLADAYFIFSGASYSPSGVTKHQSVLNSDMKLEHLIKCVQSLNIKGTLIFETPGREKDIIDILERLGDMVR